MLADTGEVLALAFQASSASVEVIKLLVAQLTLGPGGKAVCGQPDCGRVRGDSLTIPPCGPVLQRRDFFMHFK